MLGADVSSQSGHGVQSRNRIGPLRCAQRPGFEGNFRRTIFVTVQGRPSIWKMVCGELDGLQKAADQTGICGKDLLTGLSWFEMSTVKSDEV